MKTLLILYLHAQPPDPPALPSREDKPVKMASNRLFNSTRLFAVLAMALLFEVALPLLLPCHEMAPCAPCPCPFPCPCLPWHPLTPRRWCPRNSGVGRWEGGSPALAPLPLMFQYLARKIRDYISRRMASKRAYKIHYFCSLGQVFYTKDRTVTQWPWYMFKLLNTQCLNTVIMYAYVRCFFGASSG